MSQNAIRKDVAYVSGLDRSGLHPADASRQDAIIRQVEAQRLAAEAIVSTQPRGYEDRAFFPVPEFRPMPAKAKQIFAAAKEWEGFVRSVGNSHFIAEIQPLKTAGSANSEAEIAEIPIGDVPPADRDMLQEGTVFRYLVGYAKTDKGTISRKRHVYIRRGKVSQPSVEADWLSIAAMFRE